MTIKQKFSSIDQSKLTADQKAFLTKIKDVTKNFTDAEMNKKVEAPLDGFIAKAKEKMPEAIKSASAKSKAKSSQTRKPKRTPMSLAKEIRKEGESWKDAQARASKMMKEDSKDLSKTVETELDKLSKLVRSQKSRAKLSGLSGTNIKRDSVRRAKPKGRRISKDGNVYYENRDNRTDRLAPNYPKNAPFLAEGGYLTDPNFGTFQNQVLATGGAVTNERKHVNKIEDYEVRYAKPRPQRKGYLGKRNFELGGTVVMDLAGHTQAGTGGLDAGMPLDGVTGTNYTGLVGETGAMSSGEMFMNGGGLPSGAEQSYMITESFGNPAQHYARGGGVKQVGNREYSYGRNWTNDHRHVNKGEDHEVKYTRKGKFLGVFNDGGMMNEKEFSLAEAIVFIKKAGKDKMTFYYNVYGGNDYFTLQPTFATPTGKLKGYPSKVTITKEGSITGRNLTYADGGMTNLTIQDVSFATGGAVTNERKHVNHDEDYEIRYAKPRPSRKGYKGTRKFMAGGMNNETPRIYVADLEAYNNGRLEGEWLDLADYKDADELMDAIQDVLKKSGGEEYAIHDVEYVPRGMYSEYMGKRDFEQLYEMMDLAKDKDLPLEVVQDVVSQYDASAVEEFVGKYDNSVDFAEQLVDDLGIESFNDYQYYLDVSETDRRLLSQEMADSYVDDIRDEDGGNRLIEEAGMDVSEYEEADNQTQEEMLDKAREIVYDEYYDTWYDGMSDPYYFLVEEQGMYSADDFANANFVRVDYEKLADALEQDYTFIEYDGDLYVFNIR
jgi:hypothetical protein